MKARESLKSTNSDYLRMCVLLSLTLGKPLVICVFIESLYHVYTRSSNWCKLHAISIQKLKVHLFLMKKNSSCHVSEF